MLRSAHPSMILPCTTLRRPAGRRPRNTPSTTRPINGTRRPWDQASLGHSDQSEQYPDTDYLPSRQWAVAPGSPWQSPWASWLSQPALAPSGACSHTSPTRTSTCRSTTGPSSCTRPSPPLHSWPCRSRRPWRHRHSRGSGVHRARSLKPSLSPRTSPSPTTCQGRPSPTWGWWSPTWARAPPGPRTPTTPWPCTATAVHCHRRHRHAGSATAVHRFRAPTGSPPPAAGRRPLLPRLRRPLLPRLHLQTSGTHQSDRPAGGTPAAARPLPAHPSSSAPWQCSVLSTSPARWRDRFAEGGDGAN